MPRGPLGVTEVGKDSLTLTWLPPINDGGAALSAYVIEKRGPSTPHWLRVGRVKPMATSYTVTNLNQGTEYHFRVSAENSLGVGPALVSDEPILTKEIFQR